ncbi:MAG: hypothetical protein A3K11_07465 [Nitrospirae bacterium RIFCSPLOWO2_12_FULL_63_8]|nr:MAG: hypothetical protein A3K11_07465 [Nitrospirae bacterium RIFCSPLOWO2_12_FULL_63_8]
MLAELANTGLVLRGSIARRSTRCGNPACRCKVDPPILHGPYYIWTRKVAGKTVTAQLKPEHAALFKDWNRNMRKLDRTVRHVQALGLRAATLAGRSSVGAVAMRTLQSLGEPARVALLKAAEGENAGPAIMGLGQLAEKRAAPILERQLLRPDRERYVVLKAVPALQNIAGAESFAVFAKALLVKGTDESSESELASEFLTAMVQTGGARAVDPIIEWLGMASPRAFGYSADDALGKLKDRRLGPPLVAYLHVGEGPEALTHAGRTQLKSRLVSGWHEDRLRVRARRQHGGLCDEP